MLHSNVLSGGGVGPTGVVGGSLGHGAPESRPGNIKKHFRTMVIVMINTISGGSQSKLLITSSRLSLAMFRVWPPCAGILTGRQSVFVRVHVRARTTSMRAKTAVQRRRACELGMGRQHAGP